MVVQSSYKKRCLKIWVQEVKKLVFNSVLNFWRVTHFPLCLLETQVNGSSVKAGHPYKFDKFKFKFRFQAFCEEEKNGDIKFLIWGVSYYWRLRISES